MTSLPVREPQWRRPGHGRRPGTAAPGPHAPVLELQRMAGNRAVTALLARDPKPKTPAKAPEKKKDPPKQSYVAISGMDPIVFESAQLGGRPSVAVGPRPGTGSPDAGGRGGRDHDDPGRALHRAVQTVALGRALLGGDRVRQKDGKPYMKIKLTNALISSFSVSGHGGGADSKPMESWTLNADKIEYETFGGGTAAPRRRLTRAATLGDASAGVAQSVRAAES